MRTDHASRYSSIKRFVQSILTVLVVLGLLGPTTALAHPPGVTEWVSVSSDGTGGNNQSDMPAISGDGRFVAFVSLADNLVPNDTNGFADTFVHDRLTNTTERVSVKGRGREGNNHSGLAGVAAYPAISDDGSFVVYSSFADNLMPGLQFGHQVYLRDRTTGTTERISEDAAGTPGDGTSILPKVSLDGRFVAFQTNTGNLIGDGNHESHILVKDRVTGAFERVSATSTGEPADQLSEHPDITPDGRFVTFFSLATNLVPEDTNNRRDIFVRDRQTGTVVRVSVSTAGVEGNSESQWPTISDDGLVTAFQSNADTLVPGANGGIFVHDDRPAADLSVAKSDSPDPVSKGAQLTYSIVVTNNGPGSAASVQLTDSLPANVQFVSATSTAGSCTQTGNTVACDLGDISNGTSVTVSIIVKPKKASTITNTAQVNSISSDPNPANNSDTEQTMVAR